MVNYYINILKQKLGINQLEQFLMLIKKIKLKKLYIHILK